MPVTLRLVGPHLYVFGTRSLLGYNLDDIAEKSWRADSGMSPPPNFRLAILTRDFLMMVGEPGSKKLVENPSRHYQLKFYNRTTLKDAPGYENASVQQIYDLAEPAGINGWQAVEGGIYYLSGDHKLHFLRGARE